MTSLHSGRFSIIPARAIDDIRLGSAALRVLSCLGTYANRNGWAWPKVQTIAARLGCTRQAVQRQLRSLEKFGYIETKLRTGDSSKYRILHDADLSEVHDRMKAAEKGGQPDVAGQHDVAGGANVGLAGVQHQMLHITSQ